MSKELLAGIVKENAELKALLKDKHIISSEDAEFFRKLSAKHLDLVSERDRLKEKYDKLFVDYVERGREITELNDAICVLKRGQSLPTKCPQDGDHAWDSKCRKCGMKVNYNPEATIGSENEKA